MTPGEKQESKDALRDSLRSKLMNGDDSTTSPHTQDPGTPQSDDGPPHNVRQLMALKITMGGPGLAQMAAFCRQLATLVEVGIPLLRCLTILSERVEHPTLKKVVGDVARRVEEGSPFSEALASHPEVFSTLIVNVVRIGETGGILDRSLLHLADLMERRNDIRKRVTAAAAYPMAALVVCALALLVILGFAIPVFEKVYEGMDLPGVTAFVLGVSSVVEHTWWLIIAVVVGLFFGIRYLLRTNPSLKRSWDMLKLKLPIIGTLNVEVNVTRTARTLSNLLRAGVPLLEALVVTSETSENLVVGDLMRQTHDTVEQGGQMEVPLREAGIFPALVVDMIAIGDEAGRLDEMLDKIAETYDSSVNLSIRTLNAVLEPALILFMGTVILVVALAVLLPYWQLGDALSQ